MDISQPAFQAAVLNGLVDHNSYHGNRVVGPQIITNKPAGTIWATLRQQLLTCNDFTWAVAFITPDMLPPLKLVLADLARKKITGTLITGQYLGFNSPRVFQELRKIPNLDVRITTTDGFHTKAYMFDHGNYHTLLVGSANFTRRAVLQNNEWLLQVTTNEQGALGQQVRTELQTLKEQSQPLDEQWLKAYEQTWQPPVRTAGNPSAAPTAKIVPNAMQKAALHELAQLRQAGGQRGLVVSATGTGKTYLGALAVKQEQPQRFLYVVHREQIAKKSRASFQRVIGGPATDFGLLTGNHHNRQAKYLFATVQTLSQDRELQKWAADEFDYILIDEAHRAAAPSYRKLFQHFTPQFWLGMTATPDRPDAQDVYALFDYHLVYEIRLQAALEAGMLTPFHYIGVTDYVQAGVTITDTTALATLIAPERVDYILQQLDYYGYSGDWPCGLVFCSRQEEAHQLAAEFSQRGYPAQALTNQDSAGQRAQAVAALEEGKLNYIITVDLFNEGIDIPALNQIIMLRNTQSSIVFLQQLGRGLRKYPGQEFVTVIDFIGNYQNNYLIPMALTRDTSRDRTVLRQKTTLPPVMGLTTINFSQVAAQEIFASLAKVKLDAMRELRQAFKELENKLGRSPLLQDFFQWGSVDPTVFIRTSAISNYNQFLVKMGVGQPLAPLADAILTFVTQELTNGKRVHELVLLDLLLKQGTCTAEAYTQALSDHKAYVSPAVLRSVMGVLSLDFFAVKAGKQTKKARYGNQALVEQQDLLGYQLTAPLQDLLRQNDNFAHLLQDAVTTGLLLAQRYDQGEQFTRYQRYDRRDVCRLLNWPLDVSAPLYGYRVSAGVCPIFITYHKPVTDAEKQASRAARYDNSLQDGQNLRWYTRTPRHLNSPEVQELLQGVDQGQPQVTIHLFVKRDDQAGKEFYYLGPATIAPTTVAEELIGPQKKAAVGMDLHLQYPLPPQMMNLLFSEE